MLYQCGRFWAISLSVPSVQKINVGWESERERDNIHQGLWPGSSHGHCGYVVNSSSGHQDTISGFLLNFGSDVILTKCWKC